LRSLANRLNFLPSKSMLGGFRVTPGADATGLRAVTLSPLPKTSQLEAGLIIILHDPDPNQHFLGRFFDNTNPKSKIPSNGTHERLINTEAAHQNYGNTRPRVCSMHMYDPDRIGRDSWDTDVSTNFCIRHKNACLTNWIQPQFCKIPVNVFWGSAMEVKLDVLLTRTPSGRAQSLPRTCRKLVQNLPNSRQ
jgi:hypothetical protein